MPSLERASAPPALEHAHRAYGLAVASALPLPELCAGDAATFAPDVSITLGNLAEMEVETRLAMARRIGPFLWATADQFWLCVPGIARYRTTGGREIVVDPDPAGDADGVRVFLLGTALDVLLAQRAI